MFENPVLHFIASFYERLVKYSSNCQSIFLLWMRLTWGHQFLLIGLSKLHHIDTTIQFFTSLHIPSPVFHAYFVAYLETIGGILLILGLASRLIAIPLAFTMLIALATAHAEKLSQLKFITDPSALVHEAPYPFLITSLLVLFFGPGRVSIDAWLKRWAHRQPKY